MPSYATVLVGTDGSDSSYLAVDRAAEVARDAGAALLVVCAYHPMSEREQRRAADALGSDAYLVSGSHPAEDIVRTAGERAAKAGAPNVQPIVEDGDPVDVLCRLVTERRVDLVVVGNRGLNSLAGRLLGSVPANISHRAACDVLIVHTTSGR